MATKTPVDFDTDKFLDNYEENASHIKLSSIMAGSEESDTPANDKQKPQVKKTTEVKLKTGNATDLSERKIEYLENFIIPKKYARISRKSKQVPICEDFKKKIQKLMVFFSECGTITEYVNNVLDKHFQDYDDVIQHMSDNNLKI